MTRARGGRDFMSQSGAAHRFDRHQDWPAADAPGLLPKAVQGHEASAAELATPLAAPTIDTVPGSTATAAVLPIGASVAVVIDTLGDHDWYQMLLTAGQRYVFTSQAISGSNADTLLTLRNGTGSALTSNDDGGDGTQSLIAFTATSTGIFYLDAGTYNDGSSGSFNLAAIAVPPVGADSVSGTTATIATLGVGGGTAGNIETGGDRDWFRITLVAGETYLFRTGGVVADGSVDTILTLRSAAGTQLATNDDAGEGAYSAVRFTATTSGTYFLDVGAFGTSTGEYTLTAFTAPPLSVYSNDQIAAQLTDGYWGGAQHRFNVAPGGTVTVNMTALTTAGQTLAREAFALWGDVTGITFNAIATTAQITLDDNQSGAFANASYSNGITSSAFINVSTDWLNSNGTGLNSYSFQTYIHEIGHVLGLGHAGNYNGSASYASDALYLNDSWATTIMSYFDQNENSYFAGQGFTRQFLVTPMVADGVATTDLYGANTLTRTGDTTYGFGTNSGRAVYDAVVNPNVSYTVFDNGGIDTLNYAGFTQNQRISLVAEVFSNVGGRVGNVSIARGVVIENAYGGQGNDTLIGNGADNWLAGGGGNDAIDGGGGSDTAVFAGFRADYTISYESATRVTVSSAAEGADTIDNIEFLAFRDTVISTTANTAPDGATFSVAPVVENAANGTVFGQVTGSDPDAGDPLFYSLADDAGGRFAIDVFSGLLSVADGTLIDFEAVASHDIVVRVTDLAGASADFGYTVSVANGNDQAPEFLPELVTIAQGFIVVTEGTVAASPLFAIDPDQLAQVTYSVSGGADGALFTIDAATNSLRFITGPDFEAPRDAGGDNFYNVEVTASDGDLGTVLGFTIVVIDGDEVPNQSWNGTSGADSFTVADGDSWTLSGLAGNDSLTGGGLDDIIIGGRGNDLLAGEDGNDIFKVAAGDGSDRFDGGAGIDTILATKDNTVIGIGAITGIEVIGSYLVGSRIGGTSAADTLDFSGIELRGVLEIDAGGGADTIIGSAGADTLALGFGNDVLQGGDSNDTFLAKASTGIDVIDGGDGDDYIVAVANNFSLNATGLVSIEAVIASGFTGVKLVGSAGDDVLDFSATLLVDIASVAGLGGNDTIIGSLLADTIIGGLGRDVLTGGGDADSFVYQTVGQSGVGTIKADHVTDFVSGSDRIDLSAIDADTSLAGNQAFVFIGTAAFTGLGQLRLGTDGDGKVALFGNTSGSLTAELQISFDNNAPLVAADLLL